MVTWRNGGGMVGLLLLSHSVWAVGTSPADVVNDFYRTYVSGNKIITSRTYTYLDDQILTSLKRFRECELGYETVVCPIECIKFSCNYDGVWIDHYFDYFTKQEKIWPSWVSSVSSKTVSQKGKYAVVNTTMGKRPDPVVRVKVSLVLARGQWTIYNVEAQAQ